MERRADRSEVSLVTPVAEAAGSDRRNGTMSADVIKVDSHEGDPKVTKESKKKDI